MSLSPGKWHELVPREAGENVAYRRGLLEQACYPEWRVALWEMCSQDILFYINSFVWQVNPKKRSGEEVGPFITWPFQDRALIGDGGILWCVENHEDFVVEKSREMGATWLFLIVMDWLCRFKNYHDSLMMSKSAAAVDAPGRQSLFGKMRFLHNSLPEWLHPSKGFVDQKNYFGYPWTHSSVTGFSSTGRAGVSERGGEMFFDEFPHIEEAYEVLYRTAATAACRMFNGTHLGTGTAFYELTVSPNIKKLQFHWTQHPDKNKGLYKADPKKPGGIAFLEYDSVSDTIVETSKPTYPFPPDYEYDRTGRPTGGPHPGVRSPWYDKEFFRIMENETEMAKDQDINPKGSVTQFYSATMIRVLKDEYGQAPWWEGTLRFDSSKGEPVEMVAESGGRIKLWLNLRDGKPPAGDYGMGVDVAGGTGATPSCVSICNGRTGEKVLEYTDPHIDPKELGSLCVALAKLFCNEDGEGAKIAWENHGPGVTFGEQVWKYLGYWNFYRRTDELKISQTVSDAPGWTPQGGARLRLHTDYKQALWDRRYLNRSIHALEETLAFRHDGKGSVEHAQYTNKGNPSAGRENHGDIVIADALSCKMVIGDKVQRQQEEAPEFPEMLSIEGRTKRAERAERNRLFSLWR